MSGMLYVFYGYHDQVVYNRFYLLLLSLSKRDKECKYNIQCSNMQYSKNLSMLSSAGIYQSVSLSFHFECSKNGGHILLKSGHDPFQ